MRRIVPFAVAGVALMLIAGPVPAQEKKDAPGVKTQGELTAQPGVSQTPWFNDPAVRQQLKLSDEQFNKLNKAYSEYWTRFNRDWTTTTSKLEGEERARRMQELTGTFQKDFSKSTETVLQPEQQQRFTQLHLQLQGFGAFNDPMLRQKLNLTDKQLEDLRKFGQQFQQQIVVIEKSAQNDRPGALKRHQELRRQMTEQIGTILNDEQRQAWLQMTGDPFNFQLNLGTPNQNPNRQQNR